MGPIRDVGLLSSAVHRPRVTVFGRDAYSGLDAKAAVLLESLVRNHALRSTGTSRLGWLTVTVVFCASTSIMLEAPDDEAFDLVITMASGTVSYEQAAARLASWR